MIITATIRWMTFVLLLLVATTAQAQLPNPQRNLVSLQPTTDVPPKLLSTRTAVFYDSNYAPSMLKDVQRAFQKTGIDAIAYFPLSYAYAGVDMGRTLSAYFNQRKITNLVWLEIKKKRYAIAITPYNNTPEWVSIGDKVWMQEGASLNEVLKKIFQQALVQQKKLNLLVNEIPETDFPLKFFPAQRNEIFTKSALTQRIAVPIIGDHVLDSTIQAYAKTTKLKMEPVDASLTDVQLRNSGYAIVLRFAVADPKMLWHILGYPPEKSDESKTALVYRDGGWQTMHLPPDALAYKVYMKRLDYGDIFLGQPWDADLTLFSALQNYIESFKKNERY